MRVRFGDFQFDSERHELTKAGEPLEITPKAFELLEALLESRERVVPKAELHDRLWPETFVGRTSLARLINEVRTAIGDDANAPRFVRTIAGVGYAFAGDVVEAPRSSARASRSAWAVLWNNEEIPLNEGENTLGRDLDAAVQVPSSKVSRCHARIVVAGSTATLEDLGSKNGTFLQGQKIDGAHQLSEGDEIGIGPALLVFRAASTAASTATDRAETAEISERDDRRGLRLASVGARPTRSKS